MEIKIVTIAPLDLYLVMWDDGEWEKNLHFAQSALLEAVFAAGRTWRRGGEKALSQFGSSRVLLVSFALLLLIRKSKAKLRREQRRAQP